MARGQEPNAKQVIAQLRGLFRGVVKQYDPGALLAGELQDAQNARLVNGNLINRGGQSKVNGVGTTPATVSGSPLAIFDDWTGDAPNYPTYGGFQGVTLWTASDTEPNYYQVFYDFVGAALVVTTIPRDASIIYNYFAPSNVGVILVGGYWYTLLKQIVGTTYDGVGFARQFIVARATPGTSFVEVDLFGIARQGVTGSASHWTDFSLTHDGTNFIAAFRCGGGTIYTSTYETQVMKLTLDGVTDVERIGDLRGDLNTAITAGGGVAMVAGSTSPAFNVFYYGGYILAYPANQGASNLDAVGSTKPGYAGYIVKNGSTWGLINAASGANGAVGRTRIPVVHDGKVYLPTATDHDLLGDCVMRVWDPATDPAVVTAAFTLSGGRRWMTLGASTANGGNAISYQGKLYFSWTTGTEIGVGSWDGTTLEEEVWSTTWTLSTAHPVWLMPMQTGLAVVVPDGSYTPDRQKIFYSSGPNLAVWSSVSVEGIENPFHSMMPEEL